MRAGHFRPETRAARPLYRQLAERFRAEIASKSPNDRVDSEPQLAKRFGVSRFTVARAIELLADEGLIVRRQGRGTFVAGPPLRRSPSYLLSFTEAIAAQGRDATHRLLNYGSVPWRPGLPYRREAPLIGFDRLRLVDGVPTAIHRSVVSAEIAEAAGLTAKVAGAPKFSLYRLFFDAGLAVKWGAEALRARSATDEEAELLGLDDERVVMFVQRHTYAEGNVVLDAVDAVYDARRYAYAAEIRRELPADAASARRQGKAKENGYASISDLKHGFGPRLGPWDADAQLGGGKAGRADHRARRSRRPVVQ